ncbi:MAG: 50S ribosomal protein L13 [Candidatus Omnitrophica bacterium]|nr:50S ribosomal protein L13 [Candidatus Omnitrophota bacterium]MDD5352695.1 50S ribosomal protein L13 [Candidatus Omnitrophota bacterium]MDD5550294.1 50S ribosomal protein L13 [Candidatus Omnitrophota bacterium]
MNKTTYMAKKAEIKSRWYLIDADDKILGRVAAKAASLIKGKHKPIFTPHVECGDYVLVVNASKIKVTGNKLTEKKYLRYSGYPGGLKETSLENMLKDKSLEVIKRAVRRMLPRKPLYYRIIKRLKVYATDKHPYSNRKDIEKIEI